MQKFSVGEDYPVFDSLFEFCHLSTAGSAISAVKLNQQQMNITVNWAGGLYHVKKSEVSGFYYVSNIVLAILALLNYHQRGLYINTEIYCGGYMEGAFYTSDQVMTVPFHKYGRVLPRSWASMGLAKASIMLLTTCFEMGLITSSMRPPSSRLYPK